MRLDMGKEKQLLRFLGHVDFKPEGCWEWKGPRNIKGYGSARWNGEQGGAHRVAWKIFYGDIPKLMFVCHHCDNPPCVRPDHLFIGTAEDNNADAINKKRQSSSWQQRHHLTIEQVIRIEDEIEEGIKQQAIADEFGVPLYLVSKISRRRRDPVAVRRARWIRQAKERERIKASEMALKTEASVCSMPENGNTDRPSLNDGEIATQTHSKPLDHRHRLSPWVYDILKRLVKGETVADVAIAEGVRHETIESFRQRWGHCVS